MRNFQTVSNNVNWLNIKVRYHVVRMKLISRKILDSHKFIYSCDFLYSCIIYKTIKDTITKKNISGTYKEQCEKNSNIICHQTNKKCNISLFFHFKKCLDDLGNAFYLIFQNFHCETKLKKNI